MGGTPEDETLPAPGSEPGRSDPDRVLAIGSQAAGRYRVTRFLGAGGMGAVYAADDLVLGTPVALKTLKPEHDSSTVALERFRREIALARRVTHRNVCRIYDVGEHAGRVFLSMELLEGTTLADRIRTDGPLPLDELERIAAQLVRGLAALHAADIVHLDFKTANVIMVGERAVLTDFGLARSVVDRDSQLTAESGLTGTPAYMAPEQVEGRTATPASDIYSLGVVLFELATGKLPFVEDTALATAMARLQRDAPRALSIRPDLPLRWDAIIARCLMRAPAERFARVEDVLAGGAPSSRRSILAAGAGAAALAAGGVGVWRLLASREEARNPAPPPAGKLAPGELVAVLPVELFGLLRRVSRIDPTGIAFTIDLRDALATAAVPLLSHDANEMNEQPFGGPTTKLLREDPAAAWQLRGVVAVVRSTFVDRPDANGRGRLGIAVTIERRGRPPWRKTLRRPASEVMLLVDDTARAIAEQLGYAQPRRPRDAIAIEPALYARYGAALFELFSRGGRRGRQALATLVTDAPQLHRAGARFALRLVEDGRSGDAVLTRMRDALALVDPILASDPEHAVAHAVRGVAHMSLYDWKTAESALRRAKLLAPTHQRIGWCLTLCLQLQGKWDDPDADIERHDRGDPSPDVQSRLVWMYYYSRRYAELVQLAPTIIDQLKGWQRDLVVGFLALSYAELADFDRAIAAADRVKGLDNAETRANTAMVYALAGRRDEALAIRDEMYRDPKKMEVATPMMLAQMEDALGNHDAALAHLEPLVKSHQAQALWLKIERLSPALRSQPRFQAMMRELGF